MMMSIRNVFFSTLLTVLFITGCSTDYFNQTDGNMPAKADILALKRGMNQDEVRQLLGSPSAVSSLDHRTWLYVSTTMKRLAFFKPEEIDRNVVAVTFNLDGKVDKILQLTKENGKNIAIASEETPVLGTDEGFFRKYFGGVGSFMPVQATKENNGL
jgi:outer membrane protein assembly factor BamE (lipoprotein component of BamABCDE complex)